MNQKILPLSCIQRGVGNLSGGPLLWGSGPPTSGMISPDLNIRVNDLGWLYSERDPGSIVNPEDFGSSEPREGPDCCGCWRWTRVRVDSERELVVAGVGEGPRSSVDSRQGLRLSPWTRNGSAGMLNLLFA